MSEDDRTPAWKRFDEVLDGIVAEAVKTERRQAAERLRRLGTGDPATFISRSEAIDAILLYEANPPAPEPDKEPMMPKMKAQLNTESYYEERVRKAVEAERKRWAAVLMEAMANAPEQTAATLRWCHNAICPAEPEPPAPEPMTIAKLLEKLRKGGCELTTMYHWSDIKKDLTTLVEAQALRDAAIAESGGYRLLADKLLESAGLK